MSGRPVGYHSQESWSSSTVESEPDASLFGDMSPQQMRQFDDFMAAQEARRVRSCRTSDGTSVGCQTEHVPSPEPNTISLLQQEIFRLAVAQPSWGPARLRRAAFQNLGLPTPSAQLRNTVEVIISSVVGVERHFCQYLHCRYSRGHESGVFSTHCDS